MSGFQRLEREENGGVIPHGPGVSAQGDEKVLEQDRGAGCTTL